MKFLEDEKLIQLTQELSDVVCGTRVINGRIEAFSCKRAGTDKKLAHTLAEKFNNEFETSPSELWKRQNDSSSPEEGAKLKVSKPESKNRAHLYKRSPLGDFHEMGTRRLLTDLILTLNASFPDYDFSSVKPNHFLHLKTSTAVNLTNEKLSEMATQKDSKFLNNLWRIIDEVIVLYECDVFSYSPPDNTDDVFTSLTDGGISSCSTDALWSFNYFFVNKGLKKIVFFACVESYLTVADDDYLDEHMIQSTTYDGLYDSASTDMEQDIFSIAMN